MSSELHGVAFIQWGRSIKAVIYNSRIILLNEIMNDYVFFDNEQSEFIKSVLGRNLSELSETERSAVDELIAHGIFSVSCKDEDSRFQDEIESKGTFECSWALGSRDASLSGFRSAYFFKALMYLLYAKKSSSKGDLHGLLNGLRVVYNDGAKPNTAELVKIAGNVNLAMGLLWRQIKCLEFAYAVARIAFEHNVSCKFKIGVQTHPFISHAWVESDSGVVMDRRELPEEMATLISIGSA